MRVRVRLWWEFLPFTAKAALIVLVAGLTVTATARAATPLVSNDGPSGPPKAVHRLTLSDARDSAPSSAAAVTLSSFTPVSSRPRATRANVLATSAAHRGRRADHRSRRASGSRHDSDAARLEHSTRSRADVEMGSLRHAAPVALPSNPQVPAGP